MSKEIDNMDLIEYEPSNGKNYSMEDLIDLDSKPEKVILEFGATLTETILEKEYRRRHPREYFWKTKTGELINIKDMSDSHILNVLKCIQRAAEAEDHWLMLENTF